MTPFADENLERLASVSGFAGVLTMQPKPAQTFRLVGARGDNFGQVTLESNEDGLLTGTFAPGPDYPAVEALFRAFEEAADPQALSAVDRLGAKIAALGLQLRPEDGAVPVAVEDVQICTDGGISCRLRAPADLSLNGSRSGRQGSPVTSHLP